MYITNHLVESPEDKKDIYSTIHFSTGEYDPKENELFFCVMDEETVVGCAVASHISGLSSSLDELVLLDAYVGRGIELSLLQYMAYELLGMGKKYLVIRFAEAMRENPAFSWLRDLVDGDSAGNWMIKLDGMRQAELAEKRGQGRKAV